MSVKKTPLEWSETFGVAIMDPDGWRNDKKSFEEPITRVEFYERLLPCTIKLIDRDRYDYNKALALVEG